MARQPLYKYDYVTQLQRDIEDGSSLSKYKTGDFPSEGKYIKLMPNIEASEGLEDCLIEIEQRDDLSRWEKDLKEAKYIFEAFEKLKRLQATDERFWTYLTHVTLFKFLQLRWPIPWEASQEEQINHIQEHWFTNSVGNMIRHSIGGLWWSVFTTMDDKRENKYELTNYYFSLTSEFSVRRLGMAAFTRNRNAMIGVLEYMSENPERIYDKHFRTVVVTQYFSRLGGVKCIASMDKDFFKQEMTKLDRISKQYSTRNEVQSNRYLLKGIQ